MKTSALLLLCVVVYLLSFWGAPFPYTGDQKTYLSVALEMRERGSWLIPYLFDIPNFLKPPLQYWATLLGWKVTGLSLFGALLPSLLALLGSSFLMKRLALRFRFSELESATAAVFLFGTVGSLTYGTTVQMDIWILLFWLAAWDFGFQFLDTKSLRPLFVAWGLAGLMSLLKGPLYPVLWGAGFWALFLAEKNYRSRQALAWNLLASVFGAVVGLAWFVLAYQRFPNELMGAFFQIENKEKLGGNNSTWWGLWISFIVSLFPVLFWALGRWNVTRMRSVLNARSFFMFVPLLVFFTVFPYRVGSYLYPATPFMILFILASGIDGYSRKVAGCIAGVISLTAITAVSILFRSDWISGMVCVALSFTLIAWSVSLFKAKIIHFAMLSVLLLGWVRFATVEIGSPEYDSLYVLLAKARAENNAPAYFKATSKNMWHEYGWVSAILGRPVFLLGEKDSKPRTLILDDGEYSGLSPAEKEKCRVWNRLGKRSQIALLDFVQNRVGRDDPRIRRQYFVCTDL